MSMVFGAGGIPPGTTLSPDAVLSVPAAVTADGNYNAFPGAVVAPNGKILIAYKKGTAHAAGEAHIAARTGTWNPTTKTVSWAAEVTIVPFVADQWTTAVLAVVGIRVWLTAWFHIGQGSGSTTDSVRLYYSDDSGVTWSAPITLTDTFTKYSVSETAVVADASNNLWVATYGQDTADTVDSVHIFKSTNNGVSWTKTGTIALASVILNECSIIPKANGDLLAIMREETTGPGGYRESLSTDGGVTWSSPMWVSQLTPCSPRAFVDATLGVVMVLRQAALTWPPCLVIRPSATAAPGKSPWYTLPIPLASKPLCYGQAFRLDATTLGIIHAGESASPALTSSICDIYFSTVSLPV